MSIIDLWSEAIRREPYFGGHFLKTNKELTAEVGRWLCADLSVVQSFSQRLNDYCLAQSFAHQDMYHSLFKLHTAVAHESDFGLFRELMLQIVEQVIVALGTLGQSAHNTAPTSQLRSQETVKRPMLVVEVDKQFEILGGSDGTARLDFLTIEDLRGQDLTALFSTDASQVVQTARQLLIEHHRSRVEFEADIRFPGGQERTMTVHIQQISRKKEPLCYTAALYESHSDETDNILDLMMMAFESVDEGVVITEPSAGGKILFVNRAAEKLTGYKRVDLLGAQVDLLLRSNSKVCSVEDFIQSSVKSGWMGEFHYLQQDGQQRPIALHTRPVNDVNGDILAIVGIQRDLLQQHRHEQEVFSLQAYIEQIINNLNEFILVTDANFNIQYWNRALAAASQVPAASAIGRPLHDIAANLTDFVSAQPAVDDPGSEVHIQQKVLLSLFSGSRRHYQLTITPLSANPEDRMLMWVLRDIHEEELRKQQISQQNQHLRFLDRISRIVNETLDLGETLENFARAFGTVFTYRSLQVYLPVDQQKRYYRRFFSSVESDHTAEDSVVINMSGLLDLPAENADEQVRFIRLMREDVPKTHAAALLPAAEVTQLLLFPIIFSGEPIGLMSLGCRPTDHMDNDAITFIGQIISHLTVAMKNGIQFDQLERQNQKVVFLEELLARSGENPEPSQLLEHLTSDLAKIFNYQQIVFCKTSPELTCGEIIARYPAIDRQQDDPEAQVAFPQNCIAAGQLWLDVYQQDSPETTPPGLPMNIAGRCTLILETPSTYYGPIRMVAASDHYMKDLSYQHHVELMSEVLKEVILAIDHLHLHRQNMVADKAWETTFNNIQIGLATVDHQMHLLQANLAFEQMFPPEDGQQHGQFVCQLFQEQHAEADAITLPDEPQTVSWQDPRTDRYLRCGFFPIQDYRQKVIAGIIAVEDITKEREKEAHIRYLSAFPEINPNLVLSLSLQGEVVYTNPSARRFVKEVGLAEKEARQLVPVTLLFDLEQNHFQPNQTYEYLQKVGDRVLQFFVFMPVGGDTIYLSGVDVTDRLSLQDKLIKTERMRAMGEVAAGVAHDFNNLLFTILGRTQLIMLNPDSKTLVPELQVIEKAAKDGAQIVKRMQNLNRTDQHYETLKLKDIIEDSLLYSRQKQKSAHEVDGTHHEIITELDPEIAVHGNASELKEVFTNLIFNAFDAMPEGGQLRLQVEKLADETIRAVVQDTGSGIPLKIRQHIFDPFFTTKGDGGTGLGLSLVNNIINNHGGKIELESEVGKGSQFTVLLPASQQQPSKTAQPLRSVIGERFNLELLVVDDEPELLQTISEVLRLKFRTVHIANSGHEALQKIENLPYDIVLTDLGMPEISGWEVARAAKAKQPNSKVILVTGWGMNPDDELQKHSYVDKILSKPYDLHSLLSIIERMSTNGRH